MEVNLNYGISSANELFGLFLQFYFDRIEIEISRKKKQKIQK